MILFSQTIQLITAFLCITKIKSSWPVQKYKSTSIETPFINVTKTGQTEPGFLFFTPRDPEKGLGHPVIYSDDGQLVWQGSKGNHYAIQPQILDGEPVIAYWTGYSIEGFGYGYISILNSSYDEIHRVRIDCKSESFVTVFDPMQFDSCIDLHESQLTEDGTVLVTAVNVTQADLTSVGGPKKGWIQDSLVYEIDIKTNDVLFRWSAYEHIAEVPMSLSWAPIGLVGVGSGTKKTDPYAYSYLNSVAKYGDSYLVSSRYMCSVLFIAPDGSITWYLHGRTGGDFKLGPDTSFCYQHHVRFLSQSPKRVSIALHNNDNTPFTGNINITTGLLLDVELYGSKKVTLNRRTWDHAEPVYARLQGSYQSLKNGHILQGHGSIPKIEEYDIDGNIVMRAQFGLDDVMHTYRVYRYPWIGHPSTIPQVVACLLNESEAAVYVSWNGATDINSWRVYSEREIKQVPRNGFETTIIVRGLSKGDSVIVEAVGGVRHGTRSESTLVGKPC
ncbi:hypothetical protein N7495_005337 [Penicillium taxi]|uniref:uncharacterized protein n=1 Tax=Penicillium taxi TaxID=168475 RepID=UPI0025453C40|nr:uncharacterized protein N7495_005337 [Penicillium taxi]KAJ5893646.1 hypothetical protein N7495_005337 [Penicillium taxi]